MKKLILVAGLFGMAGICLAHSYKCKGTDDYNETQSRLLSVNSQTLTVKDPEGATWKGRIDKDYSPREANRNYVRFNGRYIDNSSAEYTPWYLVEKKLLRGAEKGYVKEQARGEGYFATKFFCWLNE